jgi:tRNA-splicing ligase RtcB
MTAIKQISEFEWELSIDYKPGMKVPGKIFADKELFEKALGDKGIEQVANVAFLPGIVGYSMAMPDIHWGYGFPIGGVAATDPTQNGVISPGGVGFDINCGVRLLRTDINLQQFKQKAAELMDELGATIPKGVGGKSRLRLTRSELTELLGRGSSWIIEKDFGWPEDIEHTEEKGRMKGADPGKVSQRAIDRGENQVGSLGAGNHFLEVQVVDQILRPEIAEAFGFFKDQVVVMIHSGSRGFGHQVCTDYVKIMDSLDKRLGIELPDRQLACAPTDSPEGKDYFAAMACAVNYAFSNRQCLSHLARKAFERIFKKSDRELGMSLVYDVAHNIAKFEKHVVNGAEKELCVHRKGATRAFGPGHKDLPQKYQKTGQPVFVPGDMGTASYVLVGTDKAMELSFGSTCHGAGRQKSRAKARKEIRGNELKKALEEKGIMIRAGNIGLLSEEAPEAYKDVSEVVNVCEGAGISLKVAKLKPLGVVKG